MRNAAARAGADGVNRSRLKNSSTNIAPRAGRVQHGATAAAATRHYVIERYVGLGWCLVDSLQPNARLSIGATFPAAMRRFREIAKRGIPAIVRGAS